MTPMIQSPPTKLASFPKYLPLLSWMIAAIFCVFQFYLQTTASLMTKGWIRDFHLTPVGVSNLSSAFFYAYLFMQIPVGYLNDRFNPRKILSFGALLVGIGCIALSKTDSFAIAFIARLVMGIGASFGFISMLYIASRWFSPQKFTLMIGSAESAGMVAVALASVLSAWFITHSGWRITIFTSGIIALIVMILAYSIVRDKPPAKAQNQPPQVSLKKGVLLSLSNKQVWWSGVFGFLNFAVINAISSLWGVPFLHQVYHFSLSLSAAIISMLLYGLATGTPIVGWISMRICRRKPIMLVGSCLSALFLSIAIFIPHLSVWLLFILFFLAGLTCSTYIQCFSISKERTPSHIHGISMAITNMIGMLGAPIYQFIMGTLIESQIFGLSQHDALTYRIAMGVVPAGLALSFFVALWIKETYCMSYDEKRETEQ